MSQIELTKLNMAVATGSQSTEVSVSKLNMYAVLVPGSDGSTPQRQGHVHSQIVGSL